MKITSEYKLTSGGSRLLEFFRDGKLWFEDTNFPRQDFAIGAQVAYFLCLNRKRVNEFAESEGRLPMIGFRDVIVPGKGHVREVVWTRYEEFSIGDNTINRPCLRLEWTTSKGKTGTFNFGVEKAKAIIDQHRNIADLAATYSS